MTGHSDWAGCLYPGDQGIADVIKERSADSNKILVAQEKPGDIKLLEIYEKVLEKKIQK